MDPNREFEKLRERYRKAAPAELLRIVRSSHDYRPEAVTLAQAELTRREAKEGLTVDAVYAEFEEEVVTQNQLAQEPLGIGLKVVCFLFCGLPGILIAFSQGATGHARRAREAWSWVGYGWLARAGVFLLHYVGVG